MMMTLLLKIKEQKEFRTVGGCCVSQRAGKDPGCMKGVGRVGCSSAGERMLSMLSSHK
jgi:hypothetical protein